MSSGLLRKGSIALVTGAGRGIGRAVAEALIEHGVHVVCAGRDVDQLNKMVQAVGPGVSPFLLDVADADSCRSIVTRLPPDLQAINILVNNAGHDAGGRRLFHQGDSDDWDGIIETNVKGLMRVAHAVLPGMLRRGEGQIVNLGSVAGVYSYRSGTAYNASKFAVHGFSEALRKDLDHTNLRVTEIMPGMVKTNFARSRFRGDSGAAEKFYEGFPALLDPMDVARAVIYALQQPPHVVISQLMIEPLHTEKD